MLKSNNEKTMDALLNINTAAQKGFSNSIHYHRYEPTPYHALDILFENVSVEGSDQIVDFGCGKGRLNFFLNYQFSSSVVGIEMNQLFYQEALENLKGYSKKNRRKSENIKFVCCLAEDYEIQLEENKFYFFNPFSVQVFMKVVHNILRSFEMFERKIDIILYYPSEDYIYFLENQTVFTLVKEITLPEYAHNQNERFLVYSIL